MLLTFLEAERREQKLMAVRDESLGNNTLSLQLAD
jgi:hypothetical protein